MAPPASNNAGPPGHLDLSYVLPLRASTPQSHLVAYLRHVADVAEVIVVDGSDRPVFEQHRSLFGPPVRHMAVDARHVSPMGKVGGVMTGVEAASFDHVVIADDDVFYTDDQLERVRQLLDRADVVRPQNWFDPAPWHARWDTGRILLNRVFGGDWPGTLGVRRSSLLAAGGYAGDVMFENLELVRTIEAAGGTTELALDLLVQRNPPTPKQFFDQRVRQAYDEFARPGRMLAALAVAPMLVATRWRGVAALVIAAVSVAEAGRRRAGGRTVFPPTAALWAPLWVIERAITSWLAVTSRVVFGGVRYHGVVLRRAAATRRSAVRVQRPGRTSRGREDARVPFAVSATRASG
jgi:hypothetical protein